MFAPSKRIAPASARKNPLMRLAAVLLPAPFGPISPVILPRATVNEQSSTARRPPKALTRCCTSNRMGVDSAASREAACHVSAPLVGASTAVSSATVCLLPVRCLGFCARQGRDVRLHEVGGLHSR